MEFKPSPVLAPFASIEMADSESRKERFQGQSSERNEDSTLYQKYLQMKRERDTDRSRENADRLKLEDAVDIVGTCEMMCPEFESLQRYFERDLDPFEKSPTGAYDRSLMVQTFARAAAGNDLPPLEDIRPPPILRMTVDYLLDNILVQHGIEATHNFIWGRTRAVRRDLYRQRDHSVDAIYCLERIVRYHILAFHVVCRGQREVETLEIEQLKKALQSLTEVYHDARPKYTSPNEPEFRSYYILMHIRSRQALFTLRKLPPAVYYSPVLQWALRIRFTLSRNSDGSDEHGSDVTQMDYAGFFDILSQPHTSYLTACLLEAQFDDIRRQMCLMLGLALKSTARIVTLAQFQSFLHLDTIEEAIGWISHLKWNLTSTGHVEIPQSRKPDILLPPVATATPYPRTRSALVDTKRIVPDLPAHLNGGILDSLITRSVGSKFGKGYIDPPAIPRQRRALLPVTRTANAEFTVGLGSISAVTPLQIGHNPFGRQSFGLPRSQLLAQQSLPQAHPLLQSGETTPFNPFGRPKGAITGFKLPNPSSTSNAQSWNTFATQPPTQNLSPQPTGAQASFQPSPPTVSPFSNVHFGNTVPTTQPAFTTIPSLTVPPLPDPPQSPVLPTLLQTISEHPAAPASTSIVDPSPASVTLSANSPLRLSVTGNVFVKTQDVGATVASSPSFTAKPSTPAKDIVPTPASFGHSFSFTDYKTDSGIETTPPARPFERNYLLSDDNMSASTDSSIMPASTHAQKSPPQRWVDIINLDAQSNVSSSSDDMEATDAILEHHAAQHDRISTLRNFIQRWRETSVKIKEKPGEDDIRKERAEQSALDIPLGARYTDVPLDFTKSKSRRKITERIDSTQAFMLAEKEVHDQQIWTPGTFARMVAQVAKKRRAGADLPAGWQLWTSIAPGDSVTSQWLKTKFTGDEKSPDLANISLAPANDETVAAPGLLVLQVEPGAWDTNLRRAKELLDLLPSESPYLPGLMLVMIAHPKNADFPQTWVAKLDRILQGVVMDRRGVVITGLESSQAIDEAFDNQLNELKFDLEGHAPRLGFKDVLNEYLNWWTVQYQYGREQVMLPTVDLDVALTVISVLMSGLDELLRQVILQCQITDLDIPFNGFQSRHEIEDACTEMLEYLKALGGNIRRLPVTPAAILQEPGILFRLLFRISQALKERLLQQEDSLLPRSGLRRPALEQLGREYNEKLERELLPIDRSSFIYGQSADAEMIPSTSTSLKRKRVSSTNVNGLPESTSSAEHNSEDVLDARAPHLKRSRTLEQPTKPEPPPKLSFKVEMAKARLELRAIQAVDIDRYSSVSELALVRAKTLVEIAEPLVDKVLKSDVPSDKDVIECRAVIELIATAEKAVFEEMARVKVLALSIERLARLSGVGNLEFRELVNSAKRLSQRLSY